MGEPIGHLTKQTFGYEARCAECTWKSSGANRQKVESILRAHADLMHPQPIPVYRTEEATT